MTKRFFIYQVVGKSSSPSSVLNGGPDSPRFEEIVEGSIDDARNAILSDAYQDAEYLILEDTGIVTRVTPEAPKARITFEPSRKKPRKEKAK